MKNEIQDLIEKLNYYRNMYYNYNKSIVSDQEYDNLYDELVKLEKESGIIMSNSPTQSVGFPILNNLEKVKHSHKLLSLEKTKNVNDLYNFKSNKNCIMSLKMDGLTVLLTYNNGVLSKAETRGDGTVGQNITDTVKHFINVPLEIPYKETLEIEGEAIITYDDFERLREEGGYANPRNLASGSLSLLDTSEITKRNIKFIAWKVPTQIANTYSESFTKISQYGFTIVPYVETENIENDIEYLKNIAKILKYPIDGLVISYNDIQYGLSLGETSHAPKHSIAYKFYDEEYETSLLDIEWTMGKTGIITPVAIFDTIDIDGTDVSRASLHNISIMKQTLHGCGFRNQKVYVVKRNQIIPNIEHAEEGISTFTLPDHCPICGGDIEIKCENESEVLYCSNPSCEGKLSNRISHYCDMKKGMSIKGLSNKTIEKLINLNWLNNFEDLYSLKDYRNEWVKQEGFGEKSVDNILSSIENSKLCKLENFISALSIPLIGLSNAKEIIKYVNSIKELADLASSNFDFERWATFGPEKANSLKSFDYTEAISIEELLNYGNAETASENTLENIVFCITGKVVEFKNRDELTKYIESRGGKVVSSVSSKTNYLINNDVNSQSSKNIKAKQLNIPIISEQEFKKIFD